MFKFSHLRYYQLACLYFHHSDASNCLAIQYHRISCNTVCLVFVYIFPPQMLAIAWPEGTSLSVIYQPGSQSRALMFDSFEIGSISNGIFRKMEFWDFEIGDHLIYDLVPGISFRFFSGPRLMWKFKKWNYEKLSLKKFNERNNLLIPF